MASRLQTDSLGFYSYILAINQELGISFSLSLNCISDYCGNRPCRWGKSRALQGVAGRVPDVAPRLPRQLFPARAGKEKPPLSGRF